MSEHAGDAPTRRRAGRAVATDELPSPPWHAVDAVDGLHVDRVTDADLGDPDCAQQMGPLPRRGLFERTPFGRTKHARLRTATQPQRPVSDTRSRRSVSGRSDVRQDSLARRCTFGRATGPRECKAHRSSLWRQDRHDQRPQPDSERVCTVGPTLMDCEVAPVAKDDRVRVFSLAVVADRTGRLLGRHGRLWVRDPLGEVEPLLLEPIHDDLKQLVRHLIRVVPLALSVDVVEPLLVCKQVPNQVSGGPGVARTDASSTSSQQETDAVCSS